MKDYKIDREASLEFITEIWHKFLSDDGMWHCCLEGDFMELRTAQQMPDLEAWLTANKIPFTFRGYYKDPNETVARHQSFFERWFHMCSMLGVERTLKDLGANNKEILAIHTAERFLERIVHMFFNLQGIDLGEEVRVLQQVVIDRAFSFGYVVAANNLSKEKR